MNKPQLIEEINKLPDNIQIIVAQDAEGNEFSLFDGISIEYVSKQELESGRIEYVLSEEDILDSGEEEVPSLFEKVAVIWRQ